MFRNISTLFKKHKHHSLKDIDLQKRHVTEIIRLGSTVQIVSKLLEDNAFDKYVIESTAQALKKAGIKDIKNNNSRIEINSEEYQNYSDLILDIRDHVEKTNTATKIRLRGDVTEIEITSMHSIALEKVSEELANHGIASSISRESGCHPTLFASAKDRKISHIASNALNDFKTEKNAELRFCLSCIRE